MRPILYIFVNNRLKYTMNSGRAAAQASHATSVMHKMLETFPMDHYFRQLYEAWREETPYGFGTVLVKSGNRFQFDKINMEFGKRFPTYDCIDPEYGLIEDGVEMMAKDVLTAKALLVDMNALTEDDKVYLSDFRYWGTAGDML